MKVGADQIRRALGKPAPDIRLYLLHGPDEAGADDLARLLATSLGAGAERVDMDGAMLKSDPARLVDEAAAASLFGDIRHIRVTGAGEESLIAFQALLEAPRAGNPVVAIAPTVRTTAKIVKLAIESRQAMAFGCYVPEGDRAVQMVVAVARDHGLRVAPPLAARIADAANSDRAIIAREIEKLALYLDADADRPAELDEAALEAVGADLDEGDASAAVAALIAGRPELLGDELRRLGHAGTSPIPWLRQIARRLIQLAEMRSAVDRGEAADTVMKRNRVFRGEEAATRQALQRWSPAMLARALKRVREAERALMAPAAPGAVTAEAAMLEIARGLARRG